MLDLTLVVFLDVVHHVADVHDTETVEKSVESNEVEVLQIWVTNVHEQWVRNNLDQIDEELSIRDVVVAYSCESSDGLLTTFLFDLCDKLEKNRNGEEQGDTIVDMNPCMTPLIESKGTNKAIKVALNQLQDDIKHLPKL